MNKIKEITSKDTFLIVVSDNPTVNLLNLVKYIQRLQIRIKVGIFISPSVSNYDLQNLFHWCWRNGIINIFAVFCLKCEAIQASNFAPLLNIFTFNPFGTFNVINVTESETFDDYFLSQNSNFQRHPVRMPVLSVIRMRYHERQLWRKTLQILNASYLPVHPKPNEDIQLLFERDLIDCSCYLGAIDYTKWNLAKNVILYPMTFDTIVILVPEAIPYPDLFSAYFHTV